MTVEGLKSALDLTCQLLALNKKVFTDERVLEIIKVIENMENKGVDTEFIKPFIGLQKDLMGDETQATIDNLQDLRHSPIKLRMISRFI